MRAKTDFKMFIFTDQYGPQTNKTNKVTSFLACCKSMAFILVFQLLFENEVWGVKQWCFYSKTANDPHNKHLVKTIHVKLRIFMKFFSIGIVTDIELGFDTSTICEKLCLW